MLLRRLTLAHFRNYVALDLPLEPGLSLFWGDNGQGKSNLLEAAYLLATSRSFRTSAERDLVNWFSDTDPIFARISGDVDRANHTTRLDLIIAQAAPAGDGTPTAGKAPAESVRRRARINGRDVPLLDLLGHFNAVLFSPEDVELVSGPAQRRRRYLDITLCQVDRHYVRSLRRYLRVLAQRNALLKLARDRQVPPDEFEYWDAQLTQLGGEILLARLLAIAFLNTQLDELYRRLSHQSGRLSIEYRSTVPLDGFVLPERAAPVSGEPASAELSQRFRTQLAALQPRERGAAVTLAGVHRDDAVFIVDGVDLRTFGSRGQQRLATLALKLAEMAFMETATGERPVLLLDDVLSELDPPRRAFLQEAILPNEQILLTATDLAFFDAGVLERASRYRVAEGHVTREG